MATRKISVEVVGDVSSLQRAFGKVGPAAKGVERDVGGVHSSLASLGGVAKAAGIATGGALIGIGAAVGVAGVKFDSMKQQAEIAFTTMLGSGQKAKAFLDNLQSFAAKTPFEFPDLLKASQRLLAMGFAAKDVVPTMTAIGDAVAGLGGNAETVDRVTTALGQMQAKGKASAEEMMQLTEAGIPAWQMLADKIGVSVPEAMKLVSKGAVEADTAVGALVDGMNTKFGGMMEKQSHTLAGLFSTFKDTFTQISGSVMAPFVELATKAMEGLASHTAEVSHAVESASETISDAVGGAFEAIGGFISDHKQDLTGLVSTVRDTLGDAWRDFRQMAEDAIRDVGAVLVAHKEDLKAIATLAGHIFDGVRAAARDAFGALPGLLDPVLTALGDISRAMDDFVGKVGGWKRVIEAIGVAFAAWKVAGLIVWLGQLAGAIAAVGTAASVANAGTAATGGLAAFTGRLGALKLLAANPITIAISLKLIGDSLGVWDKIGQILSFGKQKDDAAEAYKYLNNPSLLTPRAPKSVQSLTTGLSTGQTTVAKGTGMQLPTRFMPTHNTAGPGWPAVDLMAKPGTPVRAPEDGHLTRISGHDPSSAPPQGQGGPWGRSFYFVGNSGTVYYGTHLADVAVIGAYQKGDIIAVIGDYPGSSADHIHWATGVDKGSAYASSSQPATLKTTTSKPKGSTSPSAPVSATPVSSKTTPIKTTTKPKTTATGSITEMSAALDVQAALAAGTKGTKDDLAVLHKYIAELAAKIRSGKWKGHDLADLINARNDAEKEIRDIVAGKETKKSVLPTGPPASSFYTQDALDAMGGRYQSMAEAIKKQAAAAKKAAAELKKALAEQAAIVRDFRGGMEGVLKDAAQVLQPAEGPRDVAADLRKSAGEAAEILKDLSSGKALANRDQLKERLAGLKDDMKAGLDQLRDVVVSARDNVAKAWDTFADHVLKAFDDKVIGALKRSFDALADLFASKRQQETIRKATESLAKAAAGDPETAALMNQRIELWKDYYHAIADNNLDLAGTIQDQIIASENAFATRLDQVAEDQRSAASDISAAGETLISGIQATGADMIAAAITRWEDLKGEERVKIEETIRSAQEAVDTGQILLPEALERVKSALTAAGMSPDDANELIHDPIANSLQAAVKALGEAISTLTSALQAIAKALGIEAPNIRKNSQQAADGLVEPWQDAATKLEGAAGRIAQSLAQIQGAPLTDEEIAALGRLSPAERRRLIDVPFGDYDAGGFLPTGLSLAMNGTGSPEPVGVAAGGVTINLNGPVFGDKRQVAAEIYDELADIDRQRTGGRILSGAPTLR